MCYSCKPAGGTWLDFELIIASIEAFPSGGCRHVSIVFLQVTAGLPCTFRNPHPELVMAHPKALLSFPILPPPGAAGFGAGRNWGPHDISPPRDTVWIAVGPAAPRLLRDQARDPVVTSEAQGKPADGAPGKGLPHPS